MKKYLFFPFVVGLSIILTGVLFAEPLRIGVSSGDAMGAQKFNPSFNFQSTPNAPARSVDFVVYTADQGTQAAGDTCSTNPQAGAQTSGFQMASGGDIPSNYMDYLPNDFGTSPSYWAYTSNPGGFLNGNPYSYINPGDERYLPPGSWWVDPNDPPSDADTPVVPEPSTMLVLGIGLAAGALPLSRRFRRQK